MVCTSCRRVLTSHLLVILTFVGVVLGFVLGVSVRETTPSDDVIMWIGMPGDVYMRMLKMVILPLIICSVITATASLDPRCNGKVSMVSLIYIVASNGMAVLMPLVITLSARPGQGVKVTDIQSLGNKSEMMETADVFADLIRNLFPPNIVAACFEQALTVYNVSEVTQEMNITDSNGTVVLTNVTKLVKSRKVGTAQSTNALGIVICCLVLGMACSSLGEKATPFYVFFRSANEVIIKVLCWFVWATPVGVASLIAEACLMTSDLGQAIRSLGVFALIVMGSLLLHQLVLVPLAVFVLVRANPYPFLLQLGRPVMISFAAASSAVAIPESLEALKSHVDPRISHFVVPFAATINRDGSCIFIAVSTVFISQLAGEDLHVGQIFLLWILTTIVCMATPSVPSASLVTIILILSTIGVSTDLVGLLFATEWILDRLRSTVNCLSHAHCALVTQRFCQADLDMMSKDNEHRALQEHPDGTDICDLQTKHEEDIHL